MKWFSRVLPVLLIRSNFFEREAESADIERVLAPRGEFLLVFSVSNQLLNGDIMVSAGGALV